MKKIYTINIIFAAFTILLLTSSTPLDPPAKINWISFEEAVELNKKNPKKVFIDVYTDWCGWCKKMDAATFQHAYVSKYMTENFYMVKFNAEQPGPIEFKGNTFKFQKPPNSRRGYHELAAALLQGKLSYPTVAFMDEKMNLIQAIPGYRGPEEFYPIAFYMGEGLYKEKPWPDFQKSFELPF